MLSKFEQHRKLNGKPKARLFPMCSQAVFPWALPSVAFWVGVWHLCRPAVYTVMGQNPHQDSSPRSCSPSAPGLHQDNPAGAFQFQRCMGSTQAGHWASSCPLSRGLGSQGVRCPLCLRVCSPGGPTARMSSLHFNEGLVTDPF